MPSFNRLIEEATPREEDAEIVRVIEAAIACSIEGSTPFMIAITNARGEVYRELQVHGVNQLAHVCEALSDLGFTDEVSDDGGDIEGYDAFFTK